VTGGGCACVCFLKLSACDPHPIVVIYIYFIVYFIVCSKNQNSSGSHGQTQKGRCAGYTEAVWNMLGLVS